ARKSPGHGNGLDSTLFNSFTRDNDIEHRALMFLMAQKTDSVLAALARTLEQERQKLGGVVRKPSMTDAIDALQAEATPASAPHHSSYDQILPMAHEGIGVANIARQLQLPEAEVSLVMRLNAA
ncbi:DUF2802 domain-containing protein, partial [Desulfosarcina sp.]|uniref:DUF2802 domain-containing protein n=1 Tax=Desulfosarcina sp. TaxID=2027861 RepID=UPI00356A2DE7